MQRCLIAQISTIGEVDLSIGYRSSVLGILHSPSPTQNEGPLMLVSIPYTDPTRPPKTRAPILDLAVAQGVLWVFPSASAVLLIYL